MSNVATSITQGYGGNLDCRLLAGNTFQQISRMDGGVGYAPTLGINATIPLSDGDSVRCWNNKTIDVLSLKRGIHPFAVEWVWGLKASDGGDKKAVRACGSLILAGWGRGEANIVDKATSFGGSSATMKSNTAIICSQKISTSEFQVTVGIYGGVRGSEFVGGLKYDDPRLFNRSTSVGNFTAQLAMLLRAPPRKRLDFSIMPNDNSPNSFSQFIGEHLINKTLSDPSTPSPTFEDAEQVLSKFYKRFFTMVLGLNHGKIFVPAGNALRSEVGQLESWNLRMFMDPVMFYIAVVILGFHLITGIIIFALAPRRLLPRFPYNLASEISFFHASSALSDVAGTANMSSDMRSRHLKRLGGTYGYGRFKGSDKERHVGIERMSLISGYKEAVVATRASSTIPETTAIAGTVAAATSGSLSLPAEGVVSVERAVSAAGDMVVPVLTVDQIGTQAVSAVEGGISVRTVTSSVSESAVPLAVAAGDDDLVLAV